MLVTSDADWFSKTEINQSSNKEMSSLVPITWDVGGEF